MDFYSIYDQGFARVAAATIPVSLVDPAANAETILAALVAERRNRDHQRLVREEAIRTRLLPAAGALDPGLDASGR